MLKMKKHDFLTLILLIVMCSLKLTVAIISLLPIHYIFHDVFYQNKSQSHKKMFCSKKVLYHLYLDQTDVGASRVKPELTHQCSDHLFS